jgi:UrcA family protein
MKHFATTIIGALALYAISPNSLAVAAPDGARQETVKFGDLDLTRPAAAQELYRRIERAASDVCDPYVPGSYVRSIRYRDCMDQAIGRAVADVAAPLLTARYEALTGRQILQPQQAGLNR